MKNSKKKKSICVIGLGYVGLPLSIALLKHYNVYGYDLSKSRISELKKKLDRNNDLNNKERLKLTKIKYIDNLSKVKNCSEFIVTVPTPVNNKNQPDLTLISKSCIDISKVIKKNDLIIFESTFYPGMTEEYCVPIIEKYSKLKYKKDFSCGYSPERINPGDKVHKLENIVKIVSGSNSKTLKRVSQIYKKIIKAGTFKVSSIIIAEAAKVIENAQRDINIAFVNELSQIFNKMNIDTKEVLSAASTKWNFLKFYPGLVGGHCIGVDPYYLTFKSKKLNYNPKVILSGRKINDNMPDYIVKKLISILLEKNKTIINKRILILGYSFKENCSDFRNSRVTDIVNFLIKYKMKPYIHDPHIKINDVNNNQKKFFIKTPSKNSYDAVILAVAHDEFKKLGVKKIISYSKKIKIFFDIKSIFAKKYSQFRL